ncbi:hypothetical protein TEA_029979 [Camellia sinensis var. sinensis]|uniref:Peptidase S54 rhomboid domain-containing protein n=1 Tax=Camellia sinensis var. sinensis TaxID=542762 RepID=A0A4S4CWF2_CAMSN|nr:hypothetical protein TEA_029979 [Camellia sinensis var. sinensis]
MKFWDWYLKISVVSAMIGGSMEFFMVKTGFCNVSYLGHVPCLKDAWHESSIRLKGINFLDWSKDAATSACSSCRCFFSGEGSSNNSGNLGRSDLETSKRFSFSGRGWTNILLMINVLVYIAQIATQGKLLVWGAKINSLIDQGQLWRLATSSALHSNIGHLMINCFSLNSVGPTVETISGPRRFLAVYITSAIASSAMSYWLCKSPSVGASGAVFGLVGSVSVFVLRHRSLVGGGKEDLQHIARVIVLNMVIGLLFKGIDNWGHDKFQIGDDFHNDLQAQEIVNKKAYGLYKDWRVRGAKCKTSPDTLFFRNGKLPDDNM